MAEAPRIVILKGISLAFLFIVMVVGCNGIFNPSSIYKTLLDDITKKDPDYLDKSLCDLLSKCPGNAKSLERTFAAFTIICFILSTFSLIAGFLMEMTGLKLTDGIYHAIAGLAIFISACTILAATSKVDKFVKDCVYDTKPGSCPFTIFLPLGKAIDSEGYPLDLGTFRKMAKYSDKIAAGCMALFNAGLYFVTSFLIFRS